MKSMTYRENSVSGKILCSIFGHNFRMTRYVTDHFRELECACCHLQVTNDISGKTVSLTRERLEINDALITIRRHRLAASSGIMVK